jgi:hypothetical protein
MSRKKSAGWSPKLEIEISAEQHEHAIRSNSGACLIADAIKRTYPNLSGVTVDVATIRATDRENGVRYTYLTPPAAQHVLLAFDQGWANPVETLTVQRAVHIGPIYTSRKNAAARQARLDELEAIEAAGNLTSGERSALTRMRSAPRKREAITRGAPVVHVDAVHSHTTVIGGEPPVQGDPHPNLLRGRNRHFGARLADPGLVFNEAVEQAVAQRLAERSQ